MSTVVRRPVHKCSMKLPSGEQDSIASMPPANNESVTLSISNDPGENFPNSASNAVFHV